MTVIVIAKGAAKHCDGFARTNTASTFGSFLSPYSSLLTPNADPSKVFIEDYHKNFFPYKCDYYIIMCHTTVYVLMEDVL